MHDLKSVPVRCDVVGCPGKVTHKAKTALVLYCTEHAPATSEPIDVESMPVAEVKIEYEPVAK